MKRLRLMRILDELWRLLLIGVGASVAVLNGYLLITVPTDSAKSSFKVALGGTF